MYYTLMNVFTQNFSMVDISTTWRRSVGDDLYQNCASENNTDGNDTDGNSTIPDDGRFFFQTTPSGGSESNGTDDSGSSYFTDIGLIGNFIENHDQARFLWYNPSLSAYRSALLWVLAAEGIPVIYSGCEQGYAGGPEPGCREPLWSSGYQTEHAWMGMYPYIQRILWFRKNSEFYLYPYKEIFVRYDMYIFARGPVLFVLTNRAWKGTNITATFGHLPWRTGTRVCNVLTLDGPTDCLTVNSSRYLTVELNDGEPKIYSSVSLSWPVNKVPLPVDIFWAMFGVAGVFSVILFAFGIKLYRRKAQLRRGHISREAQPKNYRRFY